MMEGRSMGNAKPESSYGKAGYNSRENMKVSAQTTIQVVDTLDRLAWLYDRKDIDGIRALIAPDFTGFGTGKDERVSGSDQFRDAIERDFSQCDSFRLSFSDMEIGAEGTTAWVTAACTMNMVIDGLQKIFESRITAVLRGTGHAWQFVQIHISLPAGG
jgi:ketosteroid isomerase-like protein